jgi:hypothetical protein
MGKNYSEKDKIPSKGHCGDSSKETKHKNSAQRRGDNGTYEPGESGGSGDR